MRRFLRILVAVGATIAAGVPQASADVPVRLVSDGAWRTGTVAVPAGATVAGIRVHGRAPARIDLRSTDGFVTLDQIGGGFTEPVWIGRTRARHDPCPRRQRPGRRGVRQPGPRPGDGAGRAEGGRGSRTAADHLPRRLGRRRVAEARLAVLLRPPRGRVRAPHGVVVELQRLRRALADPRLLPLPRPQPGLVRHRLQLPRRPLRAHLRGPLRRHHEERPRRPGGRASTPARPASR